MSKMQRDTEILLQRNEEAEAKRLSTPLGDARITKALALLHEAYDACSKDGVIYKGPVLRIVGDAIRLLDAERHTESEKRAIPDFEGMIDNAAGASQSRELLDDQITRGAVKANIYDPLVELLRKK
jgi:hypothetical protein